MLRQSLKISKPQEMLMGAVNDVKYSPEIKKKKKKVPAMNKPHLIQGHNR